MKKVTSFVTVTYLLLANPNTTQVQHAYKAKVEVSCWTKPALYFAALPVRRSTKFILT